MPSLTYYLTSLSIVVFSLVLLARGGGSALAMSTVSTNQLFTTLAPGTLLPSSSNCAQWVHQHSNGREIRPQNTPYNETIGRSLNIPFFSTSTVAYDQRANSDIAARVNGQFRGTSEDILRWGACKWGFDENTVKAMAANESWWKQALHNNWTTQCPKNHPPGSDNAQYPTMCHRDYGLLQLNFDYYAAAWPEAETSSAMNVDTALSIVRACFEGYTLWMAQTNPSYAKGDAWGCLGAYNSGKWYDSQARAYIQNIQNFMNKRVWQLSYF